MDMVNEISLRERIRLNLVSAMERANISQVQLADKLGISKGTVNNWVRGNNSPDVDMVPKICRTVGISILDLYAPTVFEPQEEGGKKSAPPCSSEAMRLAKDYDGLDHWGKRQVRSTADVEMARCADELRLLRETTPDLEPEPKAIPLYWSAPAAGVASPIFGEDYDMYELQPDDPQGAMFAVKVSGDSMEPYFPDGSIAFCNKDPLADGDIGVFSVDGGGVIKQYHYDPVLKMTYLFSLNRKRSDADVLIASTSGQTLTCLGRCLTRRRFPIPGRG